MIATALILGALVVFLCAKVGHLDAESKDARERLAHLEGHAESTEERGATKC